MNNRFLKNIFIIFIFLFGCAKERTVEFNNSDRETIYRELSREINHPLLKKLIYDKRFKIYKRTARKKTNYDRVPSNYYKSPKFGLLTPAGRKMGRKYLRTNKNTLTKATEKFNLKGNSKEVITGLAGIEYSWGRLKPPHRLFNALVSVYVKVPSKRKYAVRNLQGMFEGIDNPKIEIDPYAPSSFMGAVGYCQIMPFWFSEITRRNYEDILDLNGDGIFNPFTNSDSIGFFAWYMRNRNFNYDRKSAVASYVGSGTTAKAYADAVIEYADSITD